jgi:hypothetical protein
MNTNHTIDWRRFHTDRELAGEWRILRAKIRHVIDRTCALAGKLANNEDDAYAIETLRMCVLDYVDGRRFSVAPDELSYAIGRLLAIEPDFAYDRAA